MGLKVLFNIQKKIMNINLASSYKNLKHRHQLVKYVSGFNENDEMIWIKNENTN